MQSALTTTTLNTRTLKRTPGRRKTSDAGELLIAELAARRKRLAELLRLIRLEVSQEMAESPASHASRSCQRAPSRPGRNPR
ncbi:MAG TPA: hypothetical protein VMS37_22720 [Verrucomicrobiae bacterium]|nr:hypothetical protein [Verrucomicrobiae bacterium]